MLTLTERCEAVAEPYGELVLPFDLRIRSRLRTRLASGEEAILKTERGAVLRGGDCLRAEDGRVVRIVAGAEKLMHVICADRFELTRAAYHLGNRHVAVEIGDGYLRIAADHVLGEMLLGLGAKVEELEAPFEPESGAYGGGHGHHDDAAHGGRIHQYEKQD
ncbi:MAG: urease accessory protein UreE [Betaproteobacteria bacterium]|nr:MAG: urease accessory protein UreE [Betaproteobacteria bacterium]